MLRKDSKIYVAGHRGMVGSAIVRELERQGYTNIITRTHQELDLCRQAEVERFFEEEKPEYVIDAAALVGGIKANSEHPAEFMYVNMQIQQNLIWAAFKGGVGKFLFLGSACMYPKECPQPMKEEYLLTGLPEVTNEGYALAKVCGSRICSYINREYGREFISAIPANSYGIGDSFDPEHSHVIPALLMKYHNAKKNGDEEVVLWGTGMAKREFIHNRDIASACIFLLEHYSSPEPINVGTGEEVSIMELSRMIRHITGFEGEIVTDPSKPDGMMRRICDSSRLMGMGWKPEVTLEEGIRELDAWYMEHHRNMEKQDGEVKRQGKVYLLDCTLRDGGYINDWEFPRELYDAVSEKLQVANVDFIELGIMGMHDADHFKTKFKSVEELPLPGKQPGSGAQFTVMMTGTEYKKLTIPEYVPGQSIDALRFAFFKADAAEAVYQMEDLISKGYKVFAQTMATFQYSDEELITLVRKMNRIKPYAFYIVDSFGTLYPEDIRHLYQVVDGVLDRDVLFGIHAHNNLQMANANAITFINEAKDRDIIVDGSIYGMGRGAGNAQTEVLMHYLNRDGQIYDEDIVWELYMDYFADLRKQYAWGYLPEQFLVSKYEVNPAYVWYLSRKGITDFQKIKQVVEKIPVKVRYTLFKEVAEDCIKAAGGGHDV